jgi:restriction endonuclease S subunit
MIISEIASVRTAPVFRDQAPQPQAHGNVRALTIRDVVGERATNWSDLAKVQVEQRFLRHCLKQGEVVIPSRGDHYPVWLFTGADEPVCPVGQFNIITPGPDVAPLYLAWYLSRRETQLQIGQCAAGTSIRAFNKASLLMLELEVPSPEVQARISELYRTTQRVIALRKRLNAIDEQDTAYLTEQLLRGEAQHV